MATATFVACNKEDKDEDGTSAKFPKEITTIVGTERTVIKYEMQDATRPKKKQELPIEAILLMVMRLITITTTIAVAVYKEELTTQRSPTSITISIPIELMES